MALFGDIQAGSDQLTIPDSIFGVSTNGLIERVGANQYQSDSPQIGIPATNLNDNAPSGKVGQYQESLIATGSAVTLSSGVAANVTSIVGPGSGDFDVTGQVTFKYNAATQSADGVAGIGSASATLPTDGTEAYDNTRQTTTTSNVTVFFKRRISQAANNTIYLVAKATFSAGTCTAFGAIQVRRPR